MHNKVIPLIMKPDWVEEEGMEEQPCRVYQLCLPPSKKMGGIKNINYKCQVVFPIIICFIF
jgi:hypothetical protein